MTHTLKYKTTDGVEVIVNMEWPDFANITYPAEISFPDDVGTPVLYYFDSLIS